jgi:Oligonucleotide/oligosaccharide-binding (OB)-fold
MFNRKAKWVMFHEVVETSNKTFMRDVTTIERDWLTELAYATSLNPSANSTGHIITRLRRRSTISIDINRNRHDGNEGVGKGSVRLQGRCRALHIDASGHFFRIPQSWREPQPVSVVVEYIQWKEA